MPPGLSTYRPPSTPATKTWMLVGLVQVSSPLGPISIAGGAYNISSNSKVSLEGDVVMYP